MTEASLGEALPEDAAAVHTGSLTLTGGKDAEVWEAFLAGCYHAGRVVSLADGLQRAGYSCDEVGSPWVRICSSGRNW